MYVTGILCLVVSSMILVDNHLHNLHEYSVFYDTVQVTENALLELLQDIVDGLVMCRCKWHCFCYNHKDRLTAL